MISCISFSLRDYQHPIYREKNKIEKKIHTKKAAPAGTAQAAVRKTSCPNI